MKDLKLLLLEKARTAKRETRFMEFKESFNPNSDQDWCEIMKDIVAIANSGGGVIVFGIKNDLTLSEIDSAKLLWMDSADITNKIYKYTNTSFQDFDLEMVQVQDYLLPAMIIYESRVPMVFCRVGSYRVDEKTQKSAFSQGTLYFRHGAKSEPCNAEDMSEVITRNLNYIRNSWLGDIKKWC
jgi:predicted HTH transcriptional regulator